jgi:tetratricopeptide (TPR) repeat protein
MATIPWEMYLVPGVALILLLHRFWFVYLPMRLVDKLARGDKERTQRILEWVMATPSLLGDRLKDVARVKLVRLYLPQRRFTDIERLSRAMLRHSQPPSLESDVRQRLADSLEGQGRADEADVERQRAEACLETGHELPLWYISRGKLLEKDDKHAEAYEVYKQGLERVPARNATLRLEFLLKMVLSSFNAGRPDETIRHAEEAIAGGAKDMALSIAHRMAGAACSTLGRLDEAEEHGNVALAMARAKGDQAREAECLVQLANYQKLRGRFSEAYEASTSAAKLSPEAPRQAFMVQADILRAWGRFDEALDALRQARQTTPHGTPAGERRSQAICCLSIAWLEAHMGRTEDAWQHLSEAVTELGSDFKLGLWCDATAAWVFALRGDVDRSAQIAGEVEARLPELAQDRRAQLNALIHLARAAFARGDYAEGVGCWERALELNPDPIERVSVLYYLGECHEHLHDSRAAEAAYREAIAMEIDSHNAQLARQRLAELSRSGHGPPVS